MDRLAELTTFATEHLNAMNRHDARAVSALYKGDGHWMCSPSARPLRGSGPVGHFLAQVLNAFPDLIVSGERTLVCSDGVAVEWHAVATHQGPFLGVSSTHSHVDFYGVSVFDIGEDNALRSRHYWDSAVFLRQVGALPLGLPL